MTLRAENVPRTMRDLTPMPDRTLQRLDRVAPGVAGLRTVMVNLYIVSNPDGSWALIDAGLYSSAQRILRWADQQMGPGARPTCILLTHGHFDHVGSLAELARHWDVPVYAHPLERPYLTGRSKYPPPDPTVGGGALALLSFLYPRGPIDISDRLQDLPEEGAVPGLDNWRWIPTPGHSPGHVSYFRDDDRILIAGDAFVTTKQESLIAVMSQRPEMHGPPAYYTSDWGAAELSVGRLAALQPNAVACGHGIPMVGPEVASTLEYLAEHFTDIAQPRHGRYVRQPAMSNESGVTRVPPPIVRPVLKIALGAALAGGVLYTYNRKRKMS